MGGEIRKMRRELMFSSREEVMILLPEVNVDQDIGYHMASDTNSEENRGRFYNFSIFRHE